jgi:hypothetical protein
MSPYFSQRYDCSISTSFSSKLRGNCPCILSPCHLSFVFSAMLSFVSLVSLCTSVLRYYYYHYYYITIDIITTNSVLVTGSTPIMDEVSQYDSSCTHASRRATIGFRSHLDCYTHHIFTSNHFALCYVNCITVNRLLNRPVTLHNTRNLRPVNIKRDRTSYAKFLDLSFKHCSTVLAVTSHSTEL